jgi:hypothetical protein
MVDFTSHDGTVEQVVTKSIVKIMEKAGFKYPATPLNPTKKTSKMSLEMVGREDRSPWKLKWVHHTDTDAKLRLQAVWGLPNERNWLTKTIEGSAQETDRPLYQTKYAEAKINEVLKDGLDKLLKEETLLREKLLKQK